MIVGCYTMDLYCDGAVDCKMRECTLGGGGEYVPPLQVTGQRRTECMMKAKKRGWKLDYQEGVALCPSCAKAAK